jgi:predicted amidohydrolase
VPGSFAELHLDEETKEEILVNVAYFIDNQGEVVGRYEKKNLWHPERPYVRGSKNDRHVAFDSPLGKVGMLICWDLAFPEAFRELIAQGAKIIIVPSFWKLSDASPVGMQRNRLSEQVFTDSAIVSRAFENTCVVVFCNAGGPAAEDFAGHSQVAIPFIGCIGKLQTSEEGMKLVSVDMDIPDEAETVYKVREDLASPDWHYVYRHTANHGPYHVPEGRVLQ